MTIISLAIIEAAGEGATYKMVCAYVLTLEKKLYHTAIIYISITNDKLSRLRLKIS